MSFLSSILMEIQALLECKRVKKSVRELLLKSATSFIISGLYRLENKRPVQEFGIQIVGRDGAHEKNDGDDYEDERHSFLVSLISPNLNAWNRPYYVGDTNSLAAHFREKSGLAFGR